MSATAKVSVVVTSQKDWAVMDETCKLLDSFQIPYERVVRSAQRTPEQTRQYARELESRGIQVVIAGAPMAAHLAGAIAAHVLVPVIAVPLERSPLGGLDALLSTVQMPAGVPVAAMAIGQHGARNAAMLAAQILALQDPQLLAALQAFRMQLASIVEGP